MSTPYVEGPRHAVVTADDHGAVLQIVAWCMLVVMILVTSLRLSIRLLTRNPGLDDVFVVFAMFSGIAEVVAISIGVQHGLGARAAILSSTQIRSVENDVYVSAILYLLALALSKASILLLISRIIVAKSHIRITQALGAVVLAWTIASIFGVAFQCDLPRPWDYVEQTCFSIETFWYIIGATDIATDLSFIVLPAIVIRELQMELSRKFVVMSGFTARFAVVVAQLARLVLLRHFTDSTDPTYPIAFHVATQLQTAFAIAASCIPALRMFIVNASSGLMGVSLQIREGTYDVSGSFHMQSLSKKGRSRGTPRASKSREAKAFDYAPNKSGNKAVIPGRRGEDAGHDDASDKFIIQKTSEFDVVYTDERPRAASHQRRSSDDPDDIAPPFSYLRR